MQARKIENSTHVHLEAGTKFSFFTPNLPVNTCMSKEEEEEEPAWPPFFLRTFWVPDPL